ncbi:MAG TPA: RagB/SusD family nutrient uptake outer membrane protein, partial [Gemmatimonadaceae bacterium]|nr:RagB/SusD family nutrient uptake outer membrane protein [Gemmatimonadaceae bacterium]
MRIHAVSEGAHRAFRGAAAILAAAVLGACGDVLEVDNPNNVVDDALNNPAATASIVNGAGASVIKAFNSVLAPYGAVTDELTWSGSRDGFKQLDDGGVSDPFNEYVDAATFNVSEARYLTDEAITRLLGFEKDGKLTSANELARAYLYGAMIYTLIPDMFDDFVIKSYRTEAGPPEGESKMSGLYDIAIDYATKGLAKATTPAMRGDLTATRARARHGKAVWLKVNPGTTTPTNPLVGDADVVADATAALALVGSTVDWRLEMTPNPTGGQGNPASGFEINQRLELAGGDVFFIRNAAGTRVSDIRLNDPIANIKDPALIKNADRYARITALNVDGRYIPGTVISTRELLLYLAEAALANDNTAGFTTFINQLRALDGLTPYSGQIPALDLLKHSRAVNLYMHGRRLADLYRFGIKADKWTSSSEAFRRAGCFFSIS